MFPALKNWNVRHTNSCLFYFVIAVVLASCIPVEYQDVSGDYEFQGIIGKRYESTKGLLIYGYTYDSTIKTLDAYFITEEPGVGGRNVISEEKLNPGTIIQINQVTKCKYCLGSGVEFEIDIISDTRFNKYPIWLHDIAEREIVIYKDGKAMLNGYFFEEI